jgi:O-succinylbenzoic acid--CoA ligase
MSLVPVQLARLLEVRRGAPAPAGFRCALIGGAHAPQELVGRARRAGWPLALTYGSTELSSQIATAPPDVVDGSVGPALPGVELRIGPDDEILVRGSTMARAYLYEDRTTAPVAAPDGWYHTGDLGHLDERGHLRVTGRRSDRIVTGGVTVDAVEVEEALRSHPAVIDAAVVGLPDPEWGDRAASP